MSDLKLAIEQDLARKTDGAVLVHSVEPLGGGACQELFRIDVFLEKGPRPGRTTLVLRSDAPGSLPGSISRAQEFPLVAAAHAVGVHTPEPWFEARDLTRPGATSFYMDFVEGEAIGKRVVHAQQLEQARAVLPGQLAIDLARIHTLGPAALPEGVLPRNNDPEMDALKRLRRWTDALPEPRPPIELALRWLHEHRPRDFAEVLVHGDYRVGNFLVGPDGLLAILDWEFAHFGHWAEDIAWLCVRDWRFGAVQKPCGGICSREAFYGAYAAASGREVVPALVHWWEVVGNLRWAVASVHQALRYLQGETDLELLAIARRTNEMEYEALRLVEVGPGLETTA